MRSLYLFKNILLLFKTYTMGLYLIVHAQYFPLRIAWHFDLSHLDDLSNYWGIIIGVTQTHKKNPLLPPKGIYLLGFPF